MAVPPGLVHQSRKFDKVTIDKNYLNALVRRTNLHNFCPVGPASIAISRAEYDSLLRDSRDYQSLRNALLEGGVAISALDTLVNSSPSDLRKDSAVADTQPYESQSLSQLDGHSHRSAAMLDVTHRERNVSFYPPSHKNGRVASNGNSRFQDATSWRRVSDFTSIPDDSGYDVEGENDPEEYTGVTQPCSGLPSGQQNRTLYFLGLSERTTFADFVSIIKGGKVANVIVRGDCALVTFLNGAAEFLAWSKRNDIYLQGKRIEVKWADHQFRIHHHIVSKMTRGATRNLLIRNAANNGLTEQRIRSDMEHISNLVIIEVKWRGADACVHTNSVGQAITARACMISRNAYKGCVEFLADECDVPLPQRIVQKTMVPTVEVRKNPGRTPLPNRFGLLNTEGTESDSDEENQDPNTDSIEASYLVGVHPRSSVRLDVLNSED